MMNFSVVGQPEVGQKTGFWETRDNVREPDFWPGITLLVIP